MRKINKERIKWIGLSIVTILIYTGINIYIAFSFKNILDLVDTADYYLFKVLVIESCILILLMSISFYVKSFVQRRFLSMEIQAYSGNIFSNILKSRYDIKNSGETISILTNDLSLALTSRINMFFSLVENGALLIFSLISLFYLDLKLALTVLFFSMILSKLPEIFNSFLMKKRNKQVEEISRMNSQLSNSLAGIDTIKSFSVEDFMIEDSSGFIEEAEKSTFRSKVSIQIANNSSYGFSLASQLIVMLLASIMVLNGYLTIGVILLLGQLMNFVTDPITNLLNSKNELNANNEVFENLDKLNILERKYGVKEKYHLKNSIEIKGLKLAYDDKEIFSDLNIKFEKGKKYVIIGNSGTGKTSLFKLLTGEISPQSGEILIDGMNVYDLNKKSISKLFQKVNQNIFLFAKSIQYNICFYDNYSQEDYETALRNANILKTIENLPEKSNTIFSESSDILSGGEKQRLQLARAFLRNKDVYLFDEVTSNLDYDNALLIEKAISKLDKTVISIRHKLDESLKYYDEIIVLKDGYAKKINYKDIHQIFFDETYKN